MNDQPHLGDRIRRRRILRRRRLCLASAWLPLSHLAACQTPAPPPAPTILVAQAPSPPSTTNPLNVTKGPSSNTRDLNGTLERLRAPSWQKPPAREADPTRVGAPPRGGGGTDDVTATLSSVRRRATGEQVRACWTKDAGDPRADAMTVRLVVTFDESGVSRLADIGPSDQGRMGDPALRAFAERARRAVLDPRCSNLPIPPAALGRVGTLTFRFRP